MDNEAARPEELDRQAAQEARNIVNDDRVTPAMLGAIEWAMDGGDDERDLIAGVLANLDEIYGWIEANSSAFAIPHVTAIMHVLEPVRAKIIASETARIRRGMGSTP